MWKKIDGWKTYLVAMAVVGYGVYMGVSDVMAWTAAECAVDGCDTVVDYVLGGAGLATVRSALAKVGM